MNFRLKLGKIDSPYESEMQSEILKSISNPSEIGILELFGIRKYINLNQIQYSKKFDKIQNIAKSRLDKNHKFFSKNITQFDSMKNFEDTINDLYNQGYILYEDYIFMYQNKISNINLSNMWEVVDSINSPNELYFVRLERQNQFSKKLTDSIRGLSEIKENTSMISIHIGDHEKGNKLNIKEFVKFIYDCCKKLEIKYSLKPEYIFSITHLNLFFRRYGFDVYDLDDQISKRTGANTGILKHKILKRKPYDRPDEKRQKYSKQVSNYTTLQSKFTHKDVKFGIMNYDKFIKLAENILGIS